MFEVSRQTKFKKDVKLIIKQGKNLDLLKTVVENLVKGEELSSKLR